MFIFRRLSKRWESHWCLLMLLLMCERKRCVKKYLKWKWLLGIFFFVLRLNFFQLYCVFFCKVYWDYQSQLLRSLQKKIIFMILCAATTVKYLSAIWFCDDDDYWLQNTFSCIPRYMPCGWCVGIFSRADRNMWNFS